MSSGKDLNQTANPLLELGLVKNATVHRFIDLDHLSGVADVGPHMMT